MYLNKTRYKFLYVLYQVFDKFIYFQMIVFFVALIDGMEGSASEEISFLRKMDVFLFLLMLINSTNIAWCIFGSP